jgi:hypothetical protein
MAQTWKATYSTIQKLSIPDRWIEITTLPQCVVFGLGRSILQVNNV